MFAATVATFSLSLSHVHVGLSPKLSPVTVPAGGETELVFSYYSGPKIAAELAAALWIIPRLYVKKGPGA